MLPKIISIIRLTRSQVTTSVLRCEDLIGLDRAVYHELTPHVGVGDDRGTEVVKSISKFKRFAAMAGATMILSAGAVTGFASAASAACDDSTANQTAFTPSLRSDAQISWGGSSTCGYTGDIFEADLYHYYQNLPDAYVANLQDASPSYYVTGATCDNGGSTTYYTRTYWYEGAGVAKSYKNSANATFNHC
jgi:hypothetical protein